MKLTSICSFLFLTVFLVCSCSQNKETEQSDTGQMEMGNGDHTAHAEMEMGSGEPADESIYHVTSTWKNRHNREMEMADLRGEVQVVAMVYTSCEYACPRILADMKRVQKGISEKARQNTNFVIISIDPERDTPERLSNFAAENDLSDEHWTLLNGNDGDILEIAALLGFRYKRISKTDFTHSNMISVLNRDGVVVHQRKQLSDDQTNIVQAIERLVNT